MTDKFNISKLPFLDSESRVSTDCFIFERENTTYKTTLSTILENTTLPKVQTKELIVNGVSFKGFSFKGEGIYKNETTIYDKQTKQDVYANESSGYIYKCEVESTGRYTFYASTGTKWTDLGQMITEASKSNYGVVKIGEGIDVDNGVISISSYIKAELTGRDCNVAYTTPQGSLFQNILGDGIYVVETTDELNYCCEGIRSEPISPTFLKQMTPGAHVKNTNNWYGYTEYQNSDYKCWKSGSDYVELTTDTNDETFYVTNSKYDNYDITINISSSYGKDSPLGIIMSYNTTKDGIPTYIAAVRSPCAQTESEQYKHNWYIAKDGICIDDEQTANRIIKAEQEINGVIGTWDKIAKGTTIRVIREANILKCFSTQFTKVSPLSYMLCVDMNQIGDVSNTSSGQFGFIGISQAQTRYRISPENLYIKKYVFNATDNTLYEINKTETKKLKTGFEALSMCGFGRFLKNDITNKTFYITASGAIRIEDNYDEKFRIIGNKIDAQIQQLNTIV